MIFTILNDFTNDVFRYSYVIYFCLNLYFKLLDSTKKYFTLQNFHIESANLLKVNKRVICVKVNIFY